MAKGARCCSWPCEPRQHPNRCSACVFCSMMFKDTGHRFRQLPHTLPTSFQHPSAWAEMNVRLMLLFRFKLCRSRLHGALRAGPGRLQESKHSKLHQSRFDSVKAAYSPGSHQSRLLDRLLEQVPVQVFNVPGSDTACNMPLAAPGSSLCVLAVPRHPIRFDQSAEGIHDSSSAKGSKQCPLSTIILPS